MAHQIPPDLRELAEHQCGIVTSSQAAAAGLGRGIVASHLHYGRWQRMYRGVYATFSGAPSRRAVLWAAVLSAGPGAMLSYQTAAELAGLADQPSQLIHVTVPSERRVCRMPGVVIHSSARASRALHPAALPPQTRIEETILDLVSCARTIDTAFSWILRGIGRRLTTQDKLRCALEQRSKIRWRSELAELLMADQAGFHSILELRYGRDVEHRHGLPRGSRQARFRRGSHNEYRDVLYEAYLTAVELDGRIAHPSETRWQDIQRDNSAATDGVVTLRYGWLDVTKTPCNVAAEVAKVLARRGFSGARPCSPGCPVAASEPRIPPGRLARPEHAGSRPILAAPPGPGTAGPGRSARRSGTTARTAGAGRGTTSPLRGTASPARR